MALQTFSASPKAFSGRLRHACGQLRQCAARASGMLVIASFTLVLFGGIASASSSVSVVSTEGEYAPGDFEFHKPDSCVLIEGPIVQGHAETIRALFAQAASADDFSLKTLCLNSPGGSFVEAAQIVRFLRENAIGTRLQAGARCESACALIFMAGTMQWHETWTLGTWRVMHPTARLGFHAPSLNVADGQYNAGTVTKAYDVALATMAEAVNALMVPQGRSVPNLKPSLLERILATPATSMFYIETTDQAGRWGISVGPTDLGTEITDQAIRYACVNMRA